MAGVGSALGLAFDNKSLFLDINFSWQPVATIRDRPVTLLDAQLEGTKLTVLDAAKWVTGGKVVCTCCNKYDDVRDKGFHTNATSSKGGGGDAHTLYLVSKKRHCGAVPFQRLCNAFDQGLQTSHAQRFKAFYEQLSCS